MIKTFQRIAAVILPLVIIASFASCGSGNSDIEERYLSAAQTQIDAGNTEEALKIIEDGLKYLPGSEKLKNKYDELNAPATATEPEKEETESDVDPEDIKSAEKAYKDLLVDLKYLDKLDETGVEYPLEITSYYIADIISDELPELVLTTQPDESGCNNNYVLYYEESTVRIAGCIYAYDLQYSSKGDTVFAFQKGDMDHYSIEAFTDFDNAFQSSDLTIGVDTTSETNIIYSVGEEDLTEKEFTEEFGELKSPVYRSTGRNLSGIEPGNYVVSTQSSDLIVHAIPKNGTRKIGSLKKGKSVVVIDSIEGWAKISYDDNEAGYAWVSSDYLKQKSGGKSGGSKSGGKSNEQIINDAVDFGAGVAKNVIGSIF